MTKTINALKARQNFGELLNEVFYGKEVITIERAGKAMAIILPVEEYSLWLEKQGKIKGTLEEISRKISESHGLLEKSLTDLE